MTFMDKNSIKQQFLGILPRMSLFCSDCAKIMKWKAEIIVQRKFHILMFIHFLH